MMLHHYVFPAQSPHWRLQVCVKLGGFLCGVCVCTGCAGWWTSTFSTCKISFLHWPFKGSGHIRSSSYLPSYLQVFPSLLPFLIFLSHSSFPSITPLLLCAHRLCTHTVMLKLALARWNTELSVTSALDRVGVQHVNTDFFFIVWKTKKRK